MSSSENFLLYSLLQDLVQMVQIDGKDADDKERAAAN